ncbi:hypothetical protein jhhlp_000032 [Lomentospora prolificans]|uniref:Mitochondrial-processing peptidase subunit alpha n=1 Tax=Lomentospora prolificans TaxID=41688 RepID=A0A2N3NLI8_9PEZI|nr:hypothetical protein jhhlp_000032 [Lomentospora prolificans]
MLRSLISGAPKRAAAKFLTKTAQPGAVPFANATRSLATVVGGEREPTELDSITRLPNGLRVASEALPGSFSGVGIYIDAGSRFEDESLRGVSHIMDRLAFKSTSQHSADEVLEQIEMLGGNIQCASSREAMMYQAATFNSAVPSALAVLAETIRNPKITEEEVEAQLDTAAYELHEIWAKPEMILPELVHTAAFKDNTLGNPLLCPKERLDKIDAATVQKYRELFYRPERMVVAFAGVEHTQAVQLAQRFFGDMKSSLQDAALSRTGSETSLNSMSSSDSSSSSSSLSSSGSSQVSGAAMAAMKSPSSLLSKVPFFKNLSTSAPTMASLLNTTSSTDIFRPAQYTGGFLALPPRSPSPNPALPNFSHIHLAFEGLPIVSDDIYALATLQFLLGGGGSFSAGGPGKGMYSRLYTNVLNQHAWVESCIAFNHTYTDSGLFGISASCIPGRTASMLDVMCRELRSLTLDSGFSALNEVEVSRAKHQLRSSLLMNLESRMVELEDLGRQVQIHGRKIPVADMCERIEKLTVQDLRRVARKVFGGLVEGNGSGAPTVVLQEAQPVGLASWKQIQEIIYGWGLGRR